MFPARPLRPRKQTCRARLMMSQKGHNRTHAPQQLSFYSISSVGGREECARKSEIRRLRGLRVMTRSNFGWLLSGQVRGHLEPNHCRTKSSWHSYRCLPIRSLASIRSHGMATMDGTWCFILGMMAGFIPSFAVLAFIVLGSM